LANIKEIKRLRVGGLQVAAQPSAQLTPRLVKKTISGWKRMRMDQKQLLCRKMERRCEKPHIDYCS